MRPHALQTPNVSVAFTPDRRWRRLGRGVCLLIVTSALWACHPEPERVAWPDGHWVVGDAHALAPVMRGLIELEGTPIQRHARTWLEQLEGCETFLLHAEADAPAESWLEQARCADEAGVPEALRVRRGEGAAAFLFSLSDERRLHGRIDVTADGRHTIDAKIEGEGDDAGRVIGAAGALLVQGESPAGPPKLALEDALIQARVRPAGGLDLASLVSQGSQADQMFHLRSELFVGALLDGSFEVAIYLPRRHQVTPPMALALDHTLRAGAERAMQRFVSELESTWPIHHTRREIAGEAGACFHDLKLLPDLVPCYVVTEQSIVVGWNPTSIELALGRHDEPATFASGPALDERGGWLIHLDRFPEADARLQRQLSGAAPARSLAALFDSLRIDAREDGTGVRLRADFDRRPRVGARR